MLRLDRYLGAGTRGRALDLATGRVVDLERSDGRGQPPALFESRGARVLIDVEDAPGHRVCVWERTAAIAQSPGDAHVRAAFVEALECARQGAPRELDVDVPGALDAERLRRELAREARRRGWVPIALEVCARTWDRRGRLPSWLADRSLVVFVSTGQRTRDLLRGLAESASRSARPHVLVRARLAGERARIFRPRTPACPVVREGVGEEGLAAANVPDVHAEARARWEWLADRLSGRDGNGLSALRLARVLAARDQTFEARALLDAVVMREGALHDVGELSADLERRARSRLKRGWEMVDDVLGVLQVCQDTEDEQVALARVGAFVRERLQAASVAFVVREGPVPRVLVRVGSPAAPTDAALQAIDTGVPVTPTRSLGPAESASPVRHAAQVIGALWCRWSAGMPVACEHASTLLGIAAAAAAPSVRLAVARAEPRAPRDNPVPELLGESPVMASVRDAIVRAAASPFPVLIEGESGSGKELAARAIHARSSRRDRRFCPINCAALVEDLVEAELFGHCRGAFTGAAADRPGLFEEASGGTLFLDEIAELGARVQAKLLRALQEGEVRRVGETTVRTVDVRIVAATNRPLAREVGSGSFRADLWYRLDVIRITMPPLRERLEDLPLLAQHLWQALARRAGSRTALAPATVAALAAYDWPGNIRELQNVLASMLVAAPRSGLVGPAAIPAHIARAAALERASTLDAARRQFEERYVRAALARAGNQVAGAARDLGLSRQGLAKLMARLGIAAGGRETAPRGRRSPAPGSRR